MSAERTRAPGALERELLQVLWASAHPLNAKDIQEALPGKTPAYTTVLTALERMRRKGDVIRVGEAVRGVLFAPAQSEPERASAAMIDTLADTTDPTATLLRFAGNLDEKNIEVLREMLLSNPSKPDNDGG